MQGATRMKELRDNEASTNSLHRELHTLSRTLTEAKTLLEEAPAVLDVEEYLKKCEVSNNQTSTPTYFLALLKSMRQIQYEDYMS